MNKLAKTTLQVKALLYAHLLERSHDSLLGLLWVLVNPLIMFLVHFFILKNIFTAKSNYALYLFTGFMPWFFIKISHDMGVSTLSYKLKALKNLPFKACAYNFSSVLENYLYFLIIWSLGSLYFVVMGKVTLWSFLYSYLFHIPLILFTCASVHLFSLLNVHLRDVKHILDFALKIMFLLTPILYFPSYLKDYQYLFYLNPFFHLLKPFHSLGAAEGSGLITSFMTSFLMIIITFFFEKKLNRNLFHNAR